tara:strand:- start:2108 stop:2332 length:225 start_codon:yes stop_codon:yes gene_type:complete
MEWIELTEENRPDFNKEVLVTDENLNKEEGKMLTAISLLEGTWEDEAGKKMQWKDVHNSGIIEPTHFLLIPKLK